jgi:hypothetical protein
LGPAPGRSAGRRRALPPERPERAGAWLQAQQAFAFLLSNSTTASSALLATTRRQINDMWEGRSAYSAFAREALTVVRDRLHRNTGINFPLQLP